MRQTHLTNIIKQTNEAEQNKVDLQNKERPAVEQHKTKDKPNVTIKDNTNIQ